MQEVSISAAEWQVMRVVWAHPGSSSQEIVHFLKDGFDWQAATIKTLLGRLRQKGFIQMEKVGTKYRYRPLLSESEHLDNQLHTLLSAICSTKNGQLVEQLLTLGQFSQSDLQKIAEQAQKLKKDAPMELSCHCIPGQCTCGHHH